MSEGNFLKTSDKNCNRLWSRRIFYSGLMFPRRKRQLKKGRLARLSVLKALLVREEADRKGRASSARQRGLQLQLLRAQFSLRNLRPSKSPRNTKYNFHEGKAINSKIYCPWGNITAMVEPEF